MADIKVTARFTIPGRVLRAETPIKEKGEEKKKKDESNYRQITIRLKQEKPIVISLRKEISASQVLHLNLDAYKNLISSDNPPQGVKSYDWKKLSNNKRLTAQLNIITESLGGKLDSFTVLTD